MPIFEVTGRFVLPENPPDFKLAKCRVAEHRFEFSPPTASFEPAIPNAKFPHCLFPDSYFAHDSELNFTRYFWRLGDRDEDMRVPE